MEIYNAVNKRKVLFIDRDGTIIIEPPVTFQVDSVEQIEFLPAVIRNLFFIRTKLDFEWALVTNQDGLGTDVYPQENFDVVQTKFLQILKGEGIEFDKIFVETVGVGQSETAVHSMVDFFLLIQLAGTGDELQGIKRGIMEMADGIVINKADGDNLERAKLAAAQFRNALHLFPAPESGWTPQVLTYSGFYNIGVQEVWDMVYKYIDFVKDNGYFEYRRNEQSKYWMYETINEQLRDSFYHNPTIEAMLADKESQVLKGNLTSFVAAKNLLDTYFAGLKN